MSVCAVAIPTNRPVTSRAVLILVDNACFVSRSTPFSSGLERTIWIATLWTPLANTYDQTGKGPCFQLRHTCRSTMSLQWTMTLLDGTIFWRQECQGSYFLSLMIHSVWQDYTCDYSRGLKTSSDIFSALLTVSGFTGTPGYIYTNWRARQRGSAQKLWKKCKI